MKLLVSHNTHYYIFHFYFSGIRTFISDQKGIYYLDNFF